MALTDYKVAYDNSYEEVFNQRLVGKQIANMRFEPMLVSGGSVVRTIYDISGVIVRNTVRQAASTIDDINDSTESLLVNIDREIVFCLSDGEATQAANYNPGEVIGAQAAVKIANDLDARILAEVLNAYQTFDTGDLTTGASTGVPIVLNSTTVPQLVSRMTAKLAGTANLTNLAFVIDYYVASELEQYLLGKQFDVVNAIWKNGYSGNVSMAEVYVSNNLPYTNTLTATAQLTTAEDITISGVVFHGVTTIGTTAGNFLIATSLQTSLTNLIGLINAPTTTSATQVALSAADAAIIRDTMGLVATTTLSSVSIVGRGGRMIVSEGATAASWGTGVLHAYYGAKGAIDVVVQDKSEVDIRKASDRRGVNIFSSYLAGIKTFADGAKKFLNVLIAA